MKRKNVGKVLILVMILGMLWYTGNSNCVNAKVKSVYSSNDNVTMKGKLKKVKYYYGGEYQINYVLYVKPKFFVEHSYMYDDAPIQSRICVYIDKKQWKKYKNKKVKIRGTMTENSAYYCTPFGIYDIDSIKKIEK